MGQEDVLLVLKKQPNKWHTINKIKEQLNIGRSSVLNNVNALIKWNIVKYKIVTNKYGEMIKVKIK